MLIKCAYWLYWYSLLFGEQSIAFTRPYSIGFLKDLAFFLYNSENIYLGKYLIVMVIFLCAAGLGRYQVFVLSDLLLWFCVVNIHHKIYPTLTGGEWLLNQFLFYSCFISNKFEKKDNLLSQTRVFVHNLAVIAVLVQVCLVYLFAAFAKLGDSSWMGGSAVLQTSRLPQYSLNFIVNNAKDFGWLFVFLNYLVFAYQLLFPALVWIKKIKKPVLIIGILMHLYIAFVMGIMSFGFIMILGYIYFWPEKKTIN